MGEAQEQRYICKICDKSCVSGKSLGGHMRVHLALISASKKAAKAKAKSEIKLEIDDQDSNESSRNQSNSALPIEESSYELRDNPKKSWRFSDSKNGDLKKEACCKECGKEFLSLRALSGHMRSHSIKNKMNHCKECGKGFDSLRAMFGHMKSHSKKSRVVDDSADSLSDLDNLCAVRRKRSRIRYKINPNPSFTSLNASDCAVYELGEVEEAASCLMLLSRGVRNFIRSDSVEESSDDDSVYFGSKSSFKSKKLAGNDGDFVSGSCKKAWKLGNCVSSSANAFAANNVFEFGDDSSSFAAKDEIKANFEVSEELNESTVKLDCANDSCKSNSCKKASVSDNDSVFEENSSKNDAKNVESSKSFENKPEYKCRICDKIFTSQRALGVHNAKHKMKGNISSLAYSNLDEVEEESGDVGIVSVDSSKSKEHECPICFKVFSSGQALGGHKRAHYTGFVNEINTREAMVVNHDVTDIRDRFDLNFPVNIDGGGAKGNFWWAESGTEHETKLVLTT
ncbi:hypothetical protein BUALT_Bualt04G0138500 [Buddleja alternifolia]|uniref:C2H2-type domain-containing protein n=1 Tax=Buddleja alternifolia TaxID=168488 RepID=A0AAV6XNQ8_9LAMI|nr:hypothetical protein BUALT_Bualt04G0138500 [Buddleja alternifolia]